MKLNREHFAAGLGTDLRDIDERLLQEVEDLNLIELETGENVYELDTDDALRAVLIRQASIITYGLLRVAKAIEGLKATTSEP